MYVRMYVGMYVCMYVYIYVYVYVELWRDGESTGAEGLPRGCSLEALGSAVAYLKLPSVA